MLKHQLPCKKRKIQAQIDQFRQKFSKIDQNKQQKQSIEKSLCLSKFKEKIRNNKTFIPQQEKFDLNSQKKKPSKINQKEKKGQISSNWKLFQSKVINKKSIDKKEVAKTNNFVGIDCQFVKSGDTDLLARISIVDEEGECLYDSYVRPAKIITDYMSNISGITYMHIKNAPLRIEIQKKIKQLLLNKIVIGHTTLKDLEICQLKNWKGIKAVIDIAASKIYKYSSGKLISLKKLAAEHLNMTIQEGSHSSVDDARAAMSLFNLHRHQILKQLKFI